MGGRGVTETLTITLAAILGAMLLFGLFMLLKAGVMPLDLYYWMFKGGFGSKSAWQDTLTRAAPLILTALCTALPARLGLVVIGGEGSLLLGGLAATVTGLALEAYLPWWLTMTAMALAGMIAGGLLMGSVGALSHFRGVNATICSLLVFYIALAVFNYLVEGPLKDPASLNKPSTLPIQEEIHLGNIPSLGVHWGLLFGVVFCVVMYILLDHTTFGFAARMAGGNVRAAQAAGLPVGVLILSCCFLGGAAAGLAGMVEVTAVHYQANGALFAMYGFTGILVSFIARHHPLAIIPAAILFGGLGASSGLLQRRLNLPDASVQVLTGTIFVLILFFETFYGRFKIFRGRETEEALAR